MICQEATHLTFYKGSIRGESCNNHSIAVMVTPFFLGWSRVEIHQWRFFLVIPGDRYSSEWRHEPFEDIYGKETLKRWYINDVMILPNHSYTIDVEIVVRRMCLIWCTSKLDSRDGYQIVWLLGNHSDSMMKNHQLSQRTRTQLL